MVRRVARCLASMTMIMLVGGCGGDAVRIAAAWPVPVAPAPAPAPVSTAGTRDPLDLPGKDCGPGHERGCLGGARVSVALEPGGACTQVVTLTTYAFVDSKLTPTKLTVVQSLDDRVARSYEVDLESLDQASFVVAPLLESEVDDDWAFRGAKLSADAPVLALHVSEIDAVPIAPACTAEPCNLEAGASLPPTRLSGFVVPFRDPPEKLRTCLEALAYAATARRLVRELQESACDKLDAIQFAGEPLKLAAIRDTLDHPFRFPAGGLRDLFETLETTQDNLIGGAAAACAQINSEDDADARAVAASTLLHPPASSANKKTAAGRGARAQRSSNSSAASFAKAAGHLLE